MMTLIWNALEPLRTMVMVLLIGLALSTGFYFYGKNAANAEHAAEAMRKRVTDLTVINLAAQIDSEKLAQQQSRIEALNKEITDARRQLFDKDRICFEPGDTDQLRQLWQH